MKNKPELLLEVIKDYNKHWTLTDTIEDSQIYTANNWLCRDNDIASLYIENKNGSFILECFSGIPFSHIRISTTDFLSLWDIAFKNYKEIQTIDKYTFIEQCFLLSDYFCSLFCDYINN